MVDQFVEQPKQAQALSGKSRARPPLMSFIGAWASRAWSSNTRKATKQLIRI